MTVEMRAPSGKSNFVVAVEQSSADEAGVVLPLEVERSSAEEAGVVLPRTDQVERSSAGGGRGGAPWVPRLPLHQAESWRWAFQHSRLATSHRPMRGKIALVQCDQLFGAHCHSAQHRVWALCPLDGPMFSEAEVAAMRAEVCSALGVDLDWGGAIL